MPRASLAIRMLFAACLLGATYNHVVAVIEHGWLWDYGYGAAASTFSKLYWSALTLLDPLAAALLFVRPRAGVWLTLLIIVSDVLHNTWYVATHGQWSAPFYLAQVGFLILVSCLAPVALRGIATPFRHRYQTTSKTADRVFRH